MLHVPCQPNRKGIYVPYLASATGMGICFRRALEYECTCEWKHESLQTWFKSGSFIEHYIWAVLSNIPFHCFSDSEQQLKRTCKGQFTWYDFCLRLSHAIFVAHAARVMEKLYTISTISNCLSLRLS